MFELKRVLAATDGSEHGRSAVVTAAACARRAGGTLDLVGVVEAYVVPLGAEAAEYHDTFNDELRKNAEEQASLAGSAEATIHLRSGLPSPLITEVASELESDLLVVGAHPRPAVARFLVGSTAERVIRLSHRPVLVATEPRREPFERILAAVDLSQQSVRVVEVAAKLAQIDGAELRAVYVEDRLTPMLLEAALFDEKETRHAARVQFRKMLSQVTLPSELMMSKDIREGHAGHEVLNEAREWDADLIVMGSHGFGFFNRLLLGSTSTYVLRHGHCATLVVPRPQEEA